MKHKVTHDTAKNYDLIEAAIIENHTSGTELLELLANCYGLQLFDEESTKWLLEELGVDTTDDDEDEDYFYCEEDERLTDK